MENNYLPKQATISEACEWLQDETGEPWTLARLLEHGLMPWFWLDYQAGWPDAVFNGCHEGYLAPLCFGGDTQRLAAGVSDVLVTMSRTQSGELFKLEVSPNAVSFPIDDLRFLREDIKRLASKFDAPAPKGKAGTSPSGDWKDKARAIADSEALKRYARGEREITARNICEAVATELAKDSTTHGTCGERSSGSIRCQALKGWKFIPPLAQTAQVE